MRRAWRTLGELASHVAEHHRQNSARRILDMCKDARVGRGGKGMKEQLQDGHRQQGRWILVPLADITTPKHGRVCYVSQWWAVTEHNEALFFEWYSSPQCNASKVITRRIGKGFDAPETKPRFLETAFLPHRCGDYAYGEEKGK